MLKIFVGYDHVESVAFHVLNHSIQMRAKKPVAVIPVMLSQLKGIYWRERNPKQSNEFSFSRFLTPYLSDYEGYSVFMDLDMLVRFDINEIIDLVSSADDVTVVKHEYEPKDTIKYLGAKQYPYPCKNWSSMMIFNNERCHNLTPEYVNGATPMDLHQFAWADSVGELPTEYNHLVGEYDPNPNAKIVHFTIGGPYFHEYNGCEYSKEWWEEYDDMKNCEQLVIPTLKRNEK